MAHDIAGRLRFVLPGLKGDLPGAERLRARTLGIAGVRSASANPRTGSLTVTYDPTLARDRIVTELDLLVPGITACAASAPAAPTRRGEGGRSIGTMLAEALLERTIQMAVAALI